VYAEQVAGKGRPKRDALQKALRNWEGRYRKGEMEEDPYFSLCFRNSDPIDSDFQEAALEIFGPILECQEKVIR
jgi:hypothetical protein